MSTEKKLYAFVRQEIVPLEQAHLHVSDLAIQRGYGVFDYFRVRDGRPLFLEEYLSRFYASARLMNLPVPLSDEALKATIYKMIELNGLAMSGIKMILTGGYSDSGYDIVAPNLLLMQLPITLPAQALQERGLRVITQEYVREFPEVKTINYTMGIRLLHKIKEQGADDVLYHHKGVVTELPRCNFFLVLQDGTMVTPAHDMLHGITRKHVLDLAGKRYKAVEATVTLDDIKQASEAFLTSTTKRILPVVRVDDMIIGTGKPGAITRQLLVDLIQFEKNHLSEQVPGE